MKRTFKKICSMTLVIALLLSLSAVSYADSSIINSETKNIAESLLLSAVKDNSIRNGSFSIGSSVPIYHLKNGNINKFTEAKYHVVYSNGNPVGIFTVNGADSTNPTYSFSNDFVKQLNESVLAKNKDYYLLVTESQIFAVTGSQAIELIKYDVNYLTVDIPVGGSRAFTNNTRSINKQYKADEYAPAQVLDAIAESSFNFQTSNATTEKLTNIPQTRSIGEVSGTVPSYTQPSGSYYCWAASAWCVGETLNPQGKTVQECVDYAKGKWGKGGLVSQQKKILSDIYGITPELNNALSGSQMKSLIDRDDPFIMLCFKNKDDKKLGHSVTCYKYDDSYTPVKLKVMDSLVASGASNWRWMTSPSSGTDYKITSAGTTYIYKYALTPSTL